MSWKQNTPSNPTNEYATIALLTMLLENITLKGVCVSDRDKHNVFGRLKPEDNETYGLLSREACNMDQFVDQS